MSLKRVALDPEACELLKKAKRKGETFSDVVKRIARRPARLMEFAGVWKEMSQEQIEEIQAVLKRSRELDRERADRLIKRSAETDL